MGVFFTDEPSADMSDTMAVIPGHITDEVVVIGNHRDGVSHSKLNTYQTDEQHGFSAQEIPIPAQRPITRWSEVSVNSSRKAGNHSEPSFLLAGTRRNTV